eukprot:m.270485 g.270485  ORF g.270485 m.270485 type:complete len:940 (+) comp19316_c0_seq2:2760-5579(+)
MADTSAEALAETSATPTLSAKPSSDTPHHIPCASDSQPQCATDSDAEQQLEDADDELPLRDCLPPGDPDADATVEPVFDDDDDDMSCGSVDEEDIGDADDDDEPVAESPDHSAPVSGLIESPFCTRPPVVRFWYIPDGLVVEQLPTELTETLKWRFTGVTPNLARKMLARVGFTPTSKGGWLGTWSKHMKAASFRSLGLYQKFNHFPCSFELGRKDRMYRNICHMQARYGKRHFDFVPDTYCLPNDYQLLKRAWDSAPAGSKWILKPSASARGIGIKLVSSWSQVPSSRNRSVIVQKYISKPCLIDGSKFDLRIYVYVPSFDPLQVYICHEGLARFATHKYSNKKSTISNRFMHLTNYSVNKKSKAFVSNTDSEACEGHKWGLKALMRHMQELGVDTQPIWDQICDIVIKTLLSVEAKINSGVKWNCKRPTNCHELFGFDIMLDSRYKAWLIEVNISPSMNSSSRLDKDIKGRLLGDVFNIAGYIPPPFVKSDPAQAFGQVYVDRGRKCFGTNLTAGERLKHATFVQRGEEAGSILDELTDDDVSVLMATEEQLSRRGELERIFPTPRTLHLAQFTEHPRYYNLLLAAWVSRYQHQPEAGVAFLQQLAQDALARASLPPRQVPTSSSFGHTVQFTTPDQMYQAPRKGRSRALPPIGTSVSLTTPAGTGEKDKGTTGKEAAPGLRTGRTHENADARRDRKAATASPPATVLAAAAESAAVSIAIPTASLGTVAVPAAGATLPTTTPVSPTLAAKAARTAVLPTARSSSKPSPLSARRTTADAVSEPASPHRLERSRVYATRSEDRLEDAGAPEATLAAAKFPSRSLSSLLDSPPRHRSARASSTRSLGRPSLSQPKRPVSGSTHRVLSASTRRPDHRQSPPRRGSVPGNLWNTATMSISGIGLQPNEGGQRQGRQSGTSPKLAHQRGELAARLTQFEPKF